MQSSHAVVVSALTAALLALAGAAHADSRESHCVMKKDGDKVKGKSGPCTFGQRQGYVTIDLKNGDVVELRPVGHGNQYKDQNGNKVSRSDSGGNEVTFRWDNDKRLVVTFDRGAGYSGGGYGNGYDGSGNEYQRGYDDGLHGDYGINRLDNGRFEVVWSQPFCVARYNKHAKPENYTDGCTNQQRKRSDQVAQGQKD
ncbi:MAG: hypothetical protein U1F08_09850 [Steroidobacteraceae bacterium]